MAVTSVEEPSGNILDWVGWWFNDANGDMSHVTGTVPSAGDVDGALAQELQIAKQFPYTPQAPQVLNQTGTGKTVSFFNRPTENPNVTAIAGAANLLLAALAQTTNVVTVGGGRFHLEQPKNPTYADMGWLVTAPAEAQDSGNTGDTWEGRIIGNTKLHPLLRNAFNIDNTAPDYQFQIIANYMSRYPWAHPFVDGDEGDTDGISLYFTWPYRPILQTWVADGSTVSWNLGKNIAEDSADNIIVSDEGTLLTWVTGAPATGTEFGVTEAAQDLLTTYTATPDNGDNFWALFGWS